MNTCLGMFLFPHQYSNMSAACSIGNKNETDSRLRSGCDQPTKTVLFVGKSNVTHYTYCRNFPKCESYDSKIDL